MGNIWFTADTHFNHTNIIKYCNRPFQNILEMNEIIVSNWNSRVEPKDVVYHLGDFMFSGQSSAIIEMCKRLNGYKFLIWGNHDKGAIRQVKSFQWQGQYLELKVNDQLLVLMHYAMRVWNKAHYGSWHLYGHSHGSLKDDPNMRSFDIGVDANNFYPLEFGEVKARMALKNFVPIDHHTGR